MQIKISQDAAIELKKKIEEKGEEYGIRVYIAGFGWGGPSFGMALDVPKEDDKVFEVEGVKIILDEEMVEYTPGFIIDYRNTYFGKRFSVESLYGVGGCG